MEYIINIKWKFYIYQWVCIYMISGCLVKRSCHVSSGESTEVQEEVRDHSLNSTLSIQRPFHPQTLNDFFLLSNFPWYKYYPTSQMLPFICRRERSSPLGPAPRVLKLTITMLQANDLLVVTATNRHNSQIKAIRENWIAPMWQKFGYILFHKSHAEVSLGKVLPFLCHDEDPTGRGQ